MEENEKKNKFYTKWWFWLCMVAIVLIIGFVVIMGIGFMVATTGINEVAMKVQAIDSEATLYSSAGGNTVVVDMPNYTDETKKNKKENIEKIIKNYASNGGILENYSKFIFITKINSDGKEGYFYNTTVYSLPSMEKIDDEGKTYIDFVQFTIDSFGSSSSSTNNATTTKGEDIELTQGNYVVGEDVKAGRYDVIAINGTSGNINIEGGDYNDILSDKANNYGWEKTYKNLTLKNGQIIEITNGLQVKLQAE